MNTQHLEDELTALAVVINAMRAAGNQGTEQYAHYMERYQTIKECIDAKGETDE